MKKGTLIISFLTLINFALFLLGPRQVASAQAAGANIIMLNPVTSVASCAWPTGATYTAAMALCPVNSGVASTSGLAFAFNGGTTFTLIGSSSAGVTSFNGRTGAVLPAAGDYTYAQLSSPPTSVTAGTFSVTSATIK